MLGECPCKDCAHYMTLEDAPRYSPKMIDHMGKIGKSFCSAFPNGIPDSIYFGEEDHTVPIEGQGNDIVFEAE